MIYMIHKKVIDDKPSGLLFALSNSICGGMDLLWKLPAPFHVTTWKGLGEVIDDHNNATD